MELAAQGRPAVARLQPVDVGLSRLGSPAQLAALLEVLTGPDGRALQPPDQRRELVPRIGAGSRRSPRAASIVFLKANREVYDHVYATFDYPGGRTVVFSSIESNAFDDYYEMYMGTKGTLIMNREQDALLFEEGSAATRQTAVEISPRTAGPAAQSSETMSGNTRQGSSAVANHRGRPAERSRPAAPAS